MKEIPETLTIKDHILPFCKTKPRGEVVDVDDPTCWVTQQLAQQLLPDEGVNSGWVDIRTNGKNELICFIESGYYDAISSIISDIEEPVSFGVITDALEKYLKENQND